MVRNAQYKTSIVKLMFDCVFYSNYVNMVPQSFPVFNRNRTHSQLPSEVMVVMAFRGRGHSGR